MIKKTYTFLKAGQTNDVYTLSNSAGVEIDVLTYGARLTRISVPDKNGDFADILVGCKRVEDYYEENPHFGGTIGRYGNRIGGAKFTLNGKTYALEANDGENCLHGGNSANFDDQLWSAEIENESLVLSLLSPDGAGGFPGNLRVRVTFTLTEENELVIDYFATTDEDTPCNLTNHAYFNLGGTATVLDQELMIKSKKITPVDEASIPHGDFMEIDGTAYSFYPAKKIGKDIFSDLPMLKQSRGYDFNYCLDRETEHDLEHFAYVYDPVSGRKIDCFTTLCGVQLYTANYTGGFQGKKDYVTHCALCLETQGYPNAPNCPEYPSTILKAGDTYREKTVYQFKVVK